MGNESIYVPKDLEWPHAVVGLLQEEFQLSIGETVERLNAFGRLVGMPEKNQYWVPRVAANICKGLDLLPVHLTRFSHELSDIREVAYFIRQLSYKQVQDFTSENDIKIKPSERKILKRWFDYEFNSSELNPMRHKGFGRYGLYATLIPLHSNPLMRDHVAKIQVAFSICFFAATKIDERGLWAKAQYVKACIHFRRAIENNDAIFFEDINPDELLIGGGDGLRKGQAVRKSTQDFVNFMNHLKGENSYGIRVNENDRRVRGDSERDFFGSYSAANWGGEGYLEDSEDDYEIIEGKKWREDDGSQDQDEVEDKVVISRYSSVAFSIGQVRRMESVNQVVDYYEQSYCPAELALILKANDILLNEADKVDETLKVERNKCAFILKLQVFLGLNFTSAIQAFSFNKKEFESVSIACFLEGDGYLWRKAVKLPKIEDTTVNEQPAARIMSDYVFLVDLMGLGEELNRLNEISLERDEIHGLSFVRDETYLKFLGDITSTIKDRFRKTINITDTRLSKVMAYVLINKGVGPVEAFFITGVSLSPIRTQCFYYNPSVVSLNDTYCEGLKDLVSQLKEEGVDIMLSKDRVVLNDQSCGIGRLPSLSVLTEALADVRHVIEQPKKSFVERLNLYVAYTALVVAYSTGIRAIINPMPRKNWTNSDADYLILSDKDGLASKRRVKQYPNSRVVPKTEVLVRQLELWDEFQPKLINHVLEHGFKLSDGVVRRERQLLLINEDSRVLDVATPSMIEAVLQDYLPFKMGSNRYVLCTELHERGVDYESVDAFMSHAARGQEPFGHYSTYDMMRYLQGVRKGLKDIHKEIGLKIKKAPALKGVML